MPYSCAFNGECELDPAGPYQSRSDCEQECQAAELRDLGYEVFTNLPELALHLAPSDQVEVIYRLTRTRVPRHYARPILTALAQGDLATLALYGEMHDYLRQKYSEAELVEFLTENPTYQALIALRRLDLPFSPLELGQRMIARQNYEALAALLSAYPEVEPILSRWLQFHRIDPGPQISLDFYSHLTWPEMVRVRNPMVIYWLLKQPEGNYRVALFSTLIEDREATVLQRLKAEGVAIPEEIYSSLVVDMEVENLTWLEEIGV